MLRISMEDLQKMRFRIREGDGMDGIAAGVDCIQAQLARNLRMHGPIFCLGDLKPQASARLRSGCMCLWESP